MSQKALLSIAGTDPSGGAGVQVDLQVFRDWGYHGLSAITAVVTQSTSGVISFDPCRDDVLRSQLDVIVGDVPISGIKIGMLPTLESVEAVGGFFDEYGDQLDCPVVIDTVLTSGDGHTELTRLGVAEAMQDMLFERADLVTPNLSEMERLSGRSISNRADAERAARELLECGCDAVLFKSGHMETNPDSVADLLVMSDADAIWLEQLPRVEEDVHGTGCQLSSAICAALADGQDMKSAVEDARRYLNDLLHTSIHRIGRGKSVVVRTHSR